MVEVGVCEIFCGAKVCSNCPSYSQTTFDPRRFFIWETPYIGASGENPTVCGGESRGEVG